MSQLLKKTYEIAGLGKFGSNSHPIHPATVHIPVAFLLVSNALSLLYGVSLVAPALLPFKADTENLGAITIIGYFVNIIGIIGSGPAIVTGFAELYAMINGRGLFVSDASGNKVLEPVVKMTLIHAALNDISVFVSIYNWLMVRNHPFDDYKPAVHQILLSLGALLMSVYAAFLGGGLVYKHGVGVQRMGEGAVEKENEIKKRIAKSE